MLKVREIMIRDVYTLAPEATLREAAMLLTARHVSGAPVVAGGEVVGVVSVTDILDYLVDAPPAMARGAEPDADSYGDGWSRSGDDGEPAAAYFASQWSDSETELDESFAAAESREWDRFGEHTVSEVMSRHLCAVSPNTSVPQAAAYMRRAGIHRLLVQERGKLVGIVTASDVSWAVADRGLHVGSRGIG